MVTATSALPRPGCRISAEDDHLQLSSTSEFGDELDAESSDSTPSISPFSSDDELSEPEAELDVSESEVSASDEPGDSTLLPLLFLLFKLNY